MNTFNLLAPINSTGFGVVGTNVFRAVSRIRETALFPLGGPPEIDSTFQDDVKKSLENAVYYDNKADSLRVWHHFDADLFPGCGKRGLYTFFEVSITKEEASRLSRLDFVATASKWGRQVLIDAGVTCPIHVVRPGVDEIFLKKHEPTLLSNLTTIWKPTTTVFLAGGKFSYQKGHDFLAYAFNTAFEPDDDVLLLTHCFNGVQTSGFNGPKRTEEWRNHFNRTKLGRAGRIMHFNYMSRKQQAELYSACDCGLFFSRAEGWSLPPLEIAALGKKNVVVRASATTEWVDEAGTYVVEPDGIETAFEPPFFTGSGSWAKLGSKALEQAVEHLRNIHRSKAEGCLIRNVAGQEFAKKHTWTATADSLLRLFGQT